jgi:hypothetical protein
MLGDAAAIGAATGAAGDTRPEAGAVAKRVADALKCGVK